MGVQERRQREKIKRNNQIVDAAEQVIFAKGIHKATMDDIAKEAELGKGTLYGYYKSKAEILLAINERASRKLAELFAKANSEKLRQEEIKSERLDKLIFSLPMSSPATISSSPFLKLEM